MSGAGFGVASGNATAFESLGFCGVAFRGLLRAWARGGLGFAADLGFASIGISDAAEGLAKAINVTGMVVAAIGKGATDEYCMNTASNTPCITQEMTSAAPGLLQCPINVEVLH